MAVTVKEKWIRISLHEPEPSQSRAPAVNSLHPSDTLRPPAPATARPVKAVILCGKLAFRVRVGDGDEPDWEVAYFSLPICQYLCLCLRLCVSVCVYLVKGASVSACKRQ